MQALGQTPSPAGGGGLGRGFIGASGSGLAAERVEAAGVDQLAG
jgi:hypothetical protein